MAQQIPVSDAVETGHPEEGGVQEVRADVAAKRLLIVNVAFVGHPGQPGWVLIDAGLPGTASAILKAAGARFGAGSKPAAILMTHAHFDHAGALETLAGQWQVPVYAHGLEHPYLDGTASYPAPDPKVGGGVMSLASPLLPRGPVNVAEHLRPLESDGSIPQLPGPRGRPFRLRAEQLSEEFWFVNRSWLDRPPFRPDSLPP